MRKLKRNEDREKVVVHELLSNARINIKLMGNMKVNYQDIYIYIYRERERERERERDLQVHNFLY